MTCFNPSAVVRVFLPSAKEYEKWVSEVPCIPMENKTWAWLSTPGRYSTRMAIADRDGVINISGANIADPVGGVRPALDFGRPVGVVGEKIAVGKTFCTLVTPSIGYCDIALFRSRLADNDSLPPSTDFSTKIIEALGGVA